MTKTLYIVRGCPGDGKTTLATLASLNFPVAPLIAADDMPGLYENGQYQNHLQKQSHEWCQSKVEKQMAFGEPRIFVHNTFTRHIYIKPYLELAKKYGYAAHIIHSEAVILPNGSRTKTTHGVPQEILDGMRSGFEPFNPIPKVGITPADIAAQMTGLQYPDAIIFDMDKTIKRPKDGRSFPQSPDDFELVPEFEQWTKTYDGEAHINIFSNQRGIETGQKSVEFLQEEFELLLENKILQSVEVNRGYFATHKSSNKGWVYGNYGNFAGWDEMQTPLKLDKPNTGMFAYHHKDYENTESYWVVGDAHTDNTATDWQFAQNCQKQFPSLDIRYVPIEMLNVFWSLVK